MWSYSLMGVPQRTCIGCYQVKDKKSLLRLSQIGGDIVVDLLGKKGGRGAYLCPDPNCIKKAFQASRLNKAFDTDKIDPSTSERLKQKLLEIIMR